MAYINFDLTDCGSLQTLASLGAGIPGTLPVGMNAVAGLYLIYNYGNDNRYIGKASNLQNRFNGRMLTVNEFGLAQADINDIGVFWGDANTYSTPAPVGFPPVATPAAHTLMAPGAVLANGFRILQSGLGAEPLIPNALIGPAAGVPAYAAPVVNAAIDGGLVNVEALLIRFFRQAAGVGGTITNGTYMGPFTNPLAHELIVQVEWGALPAVQIAAGYLAISIPAGGAF
jgi:hypothetical protein